MNGMPFNYHRTIHFADTDAAGVVFFARTFAICHEAYEEALIASGIELNSFFRNESVIIPIARSEASYFRPLAVGEKVRVSVVPAALTADSYEIRFEITRLGTSAEKLAAQVRTEHVCIDAKTRRRQALPPALAAWVQGPG
jgi:1,4-dihydroxy-2-naphthoyl-CoA hydrolase